MPPVRHGPALRRQARREARGVADRGAGDGKRRARDGRDDGRRSGRRGRRSGCCGVGGGLGWCRPAQGESGCSISSSRRRRWRRRRRGRRWWRQGRRGQRREQGRERPGAGVKEWRKRRREETESARVAFLNTFFLLLFRNFCETKKTCTTPFFLLQKLSLSSHRDGSHAWGSQGWR